MKGLKAAGLKRLGWPCCRIKHLWHVQMFSHDKVLSAPPLSKILSDILSNMGCLDGGVSVHYLLFHSL